MVPLQVSESKERNITFILPTYNYMYVKHVPLNVCLTSLCASS